MGSSTKYAVVFDDEQRVLKVSDTLRELLGLEQAARETLDWQSLVVEDASKFIPSKRGEVLTKAGYLKRANGEILEASFSSELMGLSDELIFVEVALVEDSAKEVVPEQVDKESLDFLTTVSHELRVALNGVIGFTNVLGGTPLSAEQHSILDKLQSCNHMLKGLINDVLEYSRVATSKIDLHCETVNVGRFVLEVADLFRERAKKKGLDLRLVVGEDSNIRASLAGMRVTQVLSNLISNAIKFTEHGWVSVSVSCRDGQLCLGVQDTGPGVDESEADSIFKPFFQLGDQSKSPEGTGLGLAICKELVGKMGGRLVLRHPDEGGSRFEITLPLRASNEIFSGSVATSATSSPAPRKSDGTKRILVVEDNRLNADILGHFLKDYGVLYDHVDNGRSAVEVYEDGKYDLILMDVMLPELNGYEATEQILLHSRRKPPVPIVGVTAKVFRRDQVRCIEAGMVEVVHKPVDFKQLRMVLDSYLHVAEPKKNEQSETLMFVEEDLKALSRVDVGFQEGKVAAVGRNSLVSTTLESYIERMKTAGTSREEIVDTAVGIVDAEVVSLIESIEGGDRKDIGMRAHSLKGALALLGARNILDLAKGLELIASDGRVPLKAAHWKSLLEGAYSEFKEQLEDYMRATKVR